MSALSARMPYDEARSLRFIFLGASGRIGRLLRTIWPSDDGQGPQVDWQLRHAKYGHKNALIWPDLSVLDPLSNHVEMCGGIDGFFVFLGSTQSTCKTEENTMLEHVTLVEAALDAAVSANISRVIVASSSAVYGAGQGKPFQEDDVLDPVNAYGAAKCEMEKTCRAHARMIGIDLCFLRIGNVAGADALLGNAAHWKQGDAPVKLDIYPDGDGPRRSYIGPKSLANVMSGLALQLGPLPEVINVAAPQSVSMNALLDAASIGWEARHVAASPLQTIMLDCRQLEDLSLITKADSSPLGIINQWRAAMGAR